MEVEDFKTWQWMLIGLLTGALFSAVRMWQGPAFANYSVDTIDVGEFEHQVYTGSKFGGGVGLKANLIAKYHQGLPLLKDVVVHPPLKDDPAQQYWITGRAYSIGSKPDDPAKIGSPQHLFEQWKGFKYAAATPYLPGYALRERLAIGKKPMSVAGMIRNAQLAELKNELGGKESFPTVLDYLKAVKAMPDVKFTYSFAWYELAAAVWALPPLAGFLLIGVAWPLTLSFMQNYGMARPPVSVKKAKPLSPKPKPAAPVPSTAGVVFKPTVAPVPLETGEKKKYGGEFYPVVRTTKD